MSDLLLELFSEEIPARMQAGAADDLKRLVCGGLIDAGLMFQGAVAFATPRRLTLHIAGLPARTPDLAEERRGPRVGAPEAAVQGFLKSAGLLSIAEATVVEDPKKGAFYAAVVAKAGRPTLDLLADIIPRAIGTFPWPKSMRWGLASAGPDPLRWVRPLHAIVATFGPETEEPEVVPFEVGGIAAGTTTFGHRFMAPAPIAVRRFEDYVGALERAKVVLDPARRRDIILYDARTLAGARGLDLVEDDALLHEVAGLVEWPVVLMGDFDAAFLDIPPEVIRATIRANQKCFVLRDAAGALAPHFILVSNLVAHDGGEAIAAGNGRVVRARLSDAKFFWDADRKIALQDRLPKLEAITFQQKLGTQGARVRRLERLARHLAPSVGADPDLAARAARLCKADLVSEMVGEFPELQGTMGRYYAAEQGEAPAVAAAIEAHYRPQGPSDVVPADPVSIAVALADKIDTLVGFWGIDEKPTGSKDPYALRRAALGVIRLVAENGLALPLVPVITDACVAYAAPAGAPAFVAPPAELATQLVIFFGDRLKVHLRDTGARHDLIDAVYALEGRDDLARVMRRVAALAAFLDGEDGANLLTGYRRAANIVRAEARRTKDDLVGAPDVGLLHEPAEQALAERLPAVAAEAEALVARDDFAGAMRTLAALRQPIDRVFEDVKVNADDPALRLNRLRLLEGFRRAVDGVADFSKIGG